MKLDKKNKNNEIKIVLMNNIGIPFQDHCGKYTSTVDEETLNSIFGDSIFCRAPGSKSLSNRSLILAALGEGKCKIQNVLSSIDTEV